MSGDWSVSNYSRQMAQLHRLQKIVMMMICWSNLLVDSRPLGAAAVLHMSFEQ